MAEKKQSAAHEITYYLNVENCKLVAVSIVIGFIIYHGFIHLKNGSDSCRWLLSDGRFQGYNAWQPYGCMMHKYSKSESRNCMHYISYWGHSSHFAFVGDSRIRQLYYEFVNVLSTDEFKVEKKHSDVHFNDKNLNLKVDFLWYPFVNLSMYNVFKAWNKSDDHLPNFIVVGSGTWSIKYFNASEASLVNFKANLTKMRPLFRQLQSRTKLIWMLQDPVIEDKLGPNRSMITNEQIDDYNKAAITELENSGAQIWKSSRLIAQGHTEDSTDGLHIGKVPLEWDTQILLNMYCNDHMNFNDGTCCSDAEPITKVQKATALVFAICIVLAVVMVIYKRKSRKSVANDALDSETSAPTTPLVMSESASKTPPAADADSTTPGYCDVIYEVMVAMAKFGIIMAYSFLCDRTTFFMKENKFYTHSNFFLPFAYIMILGFFFTEDTKQTSVLHRDQTDEWKGWMQLVILIYHYMGASKALPIYMHIRVLVSSYLFMTGFGHFFYFWKKGDYGLFRLCQCGRRCRHGLFSCKTRNNSLHRICEVLFRMNLLVVVLCFVMNRPYQFYYFVPLVSFWYIVVYITMAIWPQVTEAKTESHRRHYLYMILKFVVLVAVISLLYLSEVFFEKLFLSRPFKPLFVLSDDSIHEWRFRWELDRFSVTYGMIFAFGYLVLKKMELIDDTNHQTLFSRGVCWVVVLLSLIGLASYTTFSVLCRSKPECNGVHSYIVFIPIVSFVCLRNIPGWLRSRYSSFFAWFGKISLELFIAQYHIWLAADTHGILVLVPNYPVLNVVITSFIFVCVAHEISKITQTLAKHAVPKDWKLILRNLVCFIAILIPVCISHGVFNS